MKTGQSSNQLVIPKGIPHQVMSVYHKSPLNFSGHPGAKTEVRILNTPELHLARTMLGIN